MSVNVTANVLQNRKKIEKGIVSEYSNFIESLQKQKTKAKRALLAFAQSARHTREGNEKKGLLYRASLESSKIKKGASQIKPDPARARRWNCS